MSTNEMIWTYPSLESGPAYWEKQPTDVTGCINSFDGTFAFTDHNLIPEVLRNFLEECLYHQYNTRFWQLDINIINDEMNRYWQGPGCVPELVRKTYELQARRREGSSIDVKSVLKDIRVPTVEEFNNGG